MDYIKLREIILINIISPLGGFVPAIHEDPTDTEIIEYSEGIVFGQLTIAVTLGIITTEDLSNVYKTLTEYRTNKISPKPLMV
ncbi:hypothetical protein [Beduini massiliensis]|uniref:hypothetical protein n=1 Tax=Beduini massiliensis TaxID=1585974 RepID=UPI00059A8624|nr:hypothetical protein [Beduini massiliensis]